MYVYEVFARRGSGGAEAYEHLGQMTIRIYRSEAYKTLGSGTGAWADGWEARIDTARRKWLCLMWA